MNIKQRIKAINKKWQLEAAEEFQDARKVCCQGCSEVIDPEAADLSEVQYVKTKRGSEIIFHTACMDKVWQRKIV